MPHGSGWSGLGSARCQFAALVLLLSLPLVGLQLLLIGLQFVHFCFVIGEGGLELVILLFAECFHPGLVVLVEELNTVTKLGAQEAGDFVLLCFHDGVGLFDLRLELLLQEGALPLHDRVGVLAEIELLGQSLPLLFQGRFEGLDLLVKLCYQKLLVDVVGVGIVFLEAASAIWGLHGRCDLGLQLLGDFSLLSFDCLGTLLVFQANLVGLAFCLLFE